MELETFSERLVKLRMAKGVSARDMSLSIGQSANYINKIENKKIYPSMAAFFYICDYLGISQKDFFDIEVSNPNQLNDLTASLKKLDEKTLYCLTVIVKEMTSKK